MRNGVMALVAVSIVASFVGIVRAQGVGPTKPTIYVGLCDASAGIALDNSLFVVGGDEDNVLRIYDRDKAGNPLQVIDLTSIVQPKKKNPEVDIEGAARIGDTVFWIGSHGTNKNGNPAPNRRRLFGLKFTVEKGHVTMKQVGKPYIHLIEDLSSAPQLEKMGLHKAAQVMPKTPAGLNIEGLAATPDGKLLVGFRSPIPGRRALLVTIENPNEILLEERAKIGMPIQLDLAGLGIRSIEYWPARQEYLIVAGPYAKGTCKLYLWGGRPDDAPRPVPGVNLSGWGIEGAVVYPDSKGTAVQLLSDDGSLPECENLRDGEPGRFRAGWVNIP